MAEVWHPDSHMLAGFTSRASSMLHTYVMKAVHRRLPVAVRKRLYNKCYLNVLCLCCGKVEFSDHAFTCVHESSVCALAGGFPASAVLRVLSRCFIDVGLYTLVCKGFVLEEWYEEACSVFEDRKVAAARIVDFVRFVVGLYHAKVWLARASHRVVMEKAGLVCNVGVVSGLPCGVSSVLSDGIVRLLGVANFFAVSFGHRKSYCFFSGLDDSVQTASSSNMSKKKAPKGAFYGPAGGSFAQKKKAVLGNVKHFGDKKNISLSKSEPSGSVYSDVDSMSGNDKDMGLTGINERSLLGSVATTLKANCVNTGTIFSSLLGSPNFTMDDDEIVLPPHLSISLEKNIKKAALLARENGIIVNTDFKKQGVCSDRAVVIKEIPMNTPKEMIVTAVFTFGKIKSIKIQLISMWQKTVVEFVELMCVAKAMGDQDIWVSRDCFRALLFTLPVRTTAHNLGTLLDRTGRKTCIINRSFETGNRVCCTVVGFESEEDLDSAFHTKPIFSGCGKCGCFGHLALECDASDASTPKPFLYAKKNVPISHLTAFGGKFWAQIVFNVSFSGHPLFDFGLGTGFFPSGAFGLGGAAPLSSVDNSFLSECLASLEHSLGLLADQVSGIVKRLSFVELVSLVLSSLGTSVPGASCLSSVVDGMHNLSLNSSKILTSKVGGLETKLASLEAFIGLVLARLNLLCSSSGSLSSSFAICNVRGINILAKQEDVVCWHKWLGNMVSFVTKTKLYSIFASGLEKSFLGAGVAIIVNNFLAHHVFKVEEVPGRLISIWLLFKSKLSVTLLGLYAGVLAETHFCQAVEMNSLIAKTVNSSTFVILGEDFNKNGSGRSTSFRFCLKLGLVNAFTNHQLVGAFTWSNFRGAKKTIDYIFVKSVSEFFNTNYNAVLVSVGLSGLLDIQLNSLFKDCFSAMLLAATDKFSSALAFENVDTAWSILEEVMVASADEIFSRCWFSKFQCSKNKHFSRFFGLELLVAKIVKCFCSGDMSGIEHFVGKWSTFDNTRAHVFADLCGSGVKSEAIFKHLLLVRKDYRKSKLFESRLAKEASIRKTIDGMIRSVLDQPFRKVVLDHLVVDEELVLEPGDVKLKVNKIIEEWTRKRGVLPVLPDLWAHQYAPLNYNKLLSVVIGLPDGKAAGLFSIFNKFWKHGGEVMLRCLLDILNACLVSGGVFILWRRAWVSMIPKPYNWDGVLMNTQLIALIETARKILSKIFLDRISAVCSKFGILHENNFSVLKGMSTQFLVFAVDLMIEDALEKNQKLWPAYDSIGWHHLEASLRHIKMRDKFIKFFGGIYTDRINRVMTDFGLSDGYVVHDGLDQREFMAKTGRIENVGGLISFFVAGAFVDNTIWVGDCQAFMQYALNIATSLSISGQPISIVKKGKTHRYLEIFLSTNELSKPSLAKAHSDVQFFVNVVLRKAVTDKQFSYLVSAVLQPIISYHTQFSFMSLNVCHKWDVMVRKGFKIKTCLSCDFPNAALHYSSLYGLKSFEQLQFESKLSAVVSFSNAFGILGQLFNHKFLDLQVLGWTPLDPLQFPVRLHVSPVNNFLAGMVRIFLHDGLFLVNYLPSAFHNPGVFSMSSVLGGFLYYDSVHSLKHFGVAFADRLLNKKDCVMDWRTFCWWKWFDPRGPVSFWFSLTSEFLVGSGILPSGSSQSVGCSGSDIFNSKEFSGVQDCLHGLWSSFFEVFTDSSLVNTGSGNIVDSMAAYFPSVDLSIGVGVSGLLSSTLAEL
ncbi:hypothetical protein G9A89_017917 [Geosiphon pyriformis]|nr:hypothetical protein G9A89_017917 [Geosiphon pyriformis]